MSNRFKIGPTKCLWFSSCGYDTHKGHECIIANYAPCIDGVVNSYIKQKNAAEGGLVGSEGEHIQRQC